MVQSILDDGETIPTSMAVAAYVSESPLAIPVVRAAAGSADEEGQLQSTAGVVVANAVINAGPDGVSEVLDLAETLPPHLIDPVEFVALGLRDARSNVSQTDVAALRAHPDRRLRWAVAIAYLRAESTAESPDHAWAAAAARDALEHGTVQEQLAAASVLLHQAPTAVEKQIRSLLTDEDYGNRFEAALLFPPDPEARDRLMEICRQASPGWTRAASHLYDSYDVAGALDTILVERIHHYHSEDEKELSLASKALAVWVDSRLASDDLASEAREDGLVALVSVFEWAARNEQTLPAIVTYGSSTVFKSTERAARGARGEGVVRRLTPLLDDSELRPYVVPVLAASPAGEEILRTRSLALVEGPQALERDTRRGQDALSSLYPILASG